MPHTVCPAVLQTHAPAVHIAVAGHTWPHAPQFVAEVIVFAHVVPQSVSPAVGQWQVPAVQTASAAHACPHAPQWSVLVCVS